MCDLQAFFRLHVCSISIVLGDDFTAFVDRELSVFADIVECCTD
jgi:hypothetical protein